MPFSYDDQRIKVIQLYVYKYKRYCNVYVYVHVLKDFRTPGPQMSEQSPFSANSPLSISYSPPMSFPTYRESDNISVASSFSTMLYNLKYRNFMKTFCTEVAKMLVKKYDFLKDIGYKVSAYVSFLNIIRIDVLQTRAYHKYIYRG